MGKRGYNLSIDGLKLLSVTTGAQPDGTHEFLINALAGPASERHLHGYATIDASGYISAGGSRLKEDKGAHLGPGVSLSHSTQEIARVRVALAPPDGPSCTLLKQVGSEWLNTTPSTLGGPLRRDEKTLDAPAGQALLVYSVAMYDGRFDPRSAGTHQTVLPFSGRSRYGLVFTRLPISD